MPRTIIDADGNEIEVPTPEELTALSEKAKQADVLLTEKEQLQKQLEEEKNPDFAAMRHGAKKRSKMEEEAKKHGFDVLEDGSLVKPTERQVSSDDVMNMAEKTARRVLVQEHVQMELSSIPDGDRAKVTDVYQTLTKDRPELSRSEANEYLNYAINAVNPNLGISRIRQAASAPLGREPRFAATAGAGVTETTKEIGKDLGVNPNDYVKGGDVSDLLLGK